MIDDEESGTIGLSLMDGRDQTKSIAVDRNDGHSMRAGMCVHP